MARLDFRKNLTEDKRRESRSHAQRKGPSGSGWTPETGGATASKSEWRRGWGTVDGLTILYIESMQVGVDLLMSVLGHICFSISGCSLAHFGELRGAFSARTPGFVTHMSLVIENTNTGHQVNCHVPA